MILLNGHSLTAERVVPLESMNLQLKEREGTATITPADMEGIGIGNWMLDDRGPENGIVWRVRSIQETFNTKTPQVQLEHAIATLKDQILFGEHKPADISGTTGETTCTARQAVTYILARQSDWTLGSFDYDSVSNPYKFDGENLLEALEIVTNSLEDALWTYDFSSYPFTINITEHSAAVDSELRAGRNLRTISRTIDKSGMYTRFYPIGKDDLHIPGNYVERNTELYGIVSKVETDQTLDTAAELTRWAEERLRDHAEPVVTITAEGLELSRATGEELDALTIGRVCRVALPEFGTTIQERIVDKTYQDKIRQPEVVKITLANSRADVAKIIAEMIRRGGGGGRASARQQKEDHAWFEDTNDHVSMTAVGIIGVDAEGKPNWTRLSEFIADGEGLHAKVETAVNGLSDQVATLEINEREIRSEVSAASSEIYTTISQTASGIHTEIVSTQSGLRAYIDQTASSFSQTYISKTNKTWIQDTDPRGSGETPKAGDIWVESTHQGTWDGAEGFDWEHDEDYDWTQVQGAKVWGWQNDKWELVSDQQQVVSMTDVEQTAEHIIQRAIRVMTNDDGNLSAYRAQLIVEGNRIRSEVNELISDVGSSVEQTASAIRSEVHAAQSDLYSFILQTASQITIRVGESNRVFSGLDEPQGTEDHPLVDGDLWLETNFQRTWTDLEELDAWIDDEDVDWSDLKGSKVHVYDGTTGAFREVLDEQVLAQDTDIDETSEKVSLVARSVRQVNGKLDVLRAELKVKSDSITSTVEQKVAQLGSSITQTASQIRSEVHAAQSTIYSSITQTASQIRAEVTDTANGLSSSITQQSDRISLVVEGTGSNAHIKPASIVQAINDGASSIKLSADHIILDGDAVATSLSGKTIGVGTLTVEGTSSFSRNAYFESTILSEGKITSNGVIDAASGFKTGDYTATWKSYTARRITLSTSRYTFPDSGGVGHYMYAVTGYTDTTLYYLGR